MEFPIGAKVRFRPHAEVTENALKSERVIVSGYSDDAEHVTVIAYPRAGKAFEQTVLPNEIELVS